MTTRTTELTRSLARWMIKEGLDPDEAIAVYATQIGSLIAFGLRKEKSERNDLIEAALAVAFDHAKSIATTLHTKDVKSGLWRVQ